MTILPAPPPDWKRPAMPKGIKAYACSTSNKFFPRVRGTIEQRFWSKVCPEPNTGCWLWGGDSNGSYGSLGVCRNGKMIRVLAHRLSFEMHVGPIPAHLQIDHKCRMKMCVNPEHLELVTPWENSMRTPVGMRGNNQIKTTCKHGHALAGENLRFDSRGHALCRTCSMDYRRRYESKRGVTPRWTITFDGVTQTAAEWEKQLGLKRGLLKHRRAAGWSAERMLLTPKAPRSTRKSQR